VSFSATLKKARKLVAEKARASNTNANKIIITSDFNQELKGELVIILHNMLDE